MNSAIGSVPSVLVGLAVLLGSAGASAQATVDSENSYPNVGAIMVWRVDDSGKPVELRGFASGTLIRPRVMITAGHFTAPVKALGGIPPAIPLTTIVGYGLTSPGRASGAAVDTWPWDGSSPTSATAARTAAATTTTIASTRARFRSGSTTP